MAGSITVSSITLDSDNTFRILSNTGSSLYTLNSVNQSVTGNLSVDATGTTGIRAPSANTLAFYEGGVEAMRIDSSGNVGIGTSSPAFPLDISAASGTTARIKSTGNYSYFRLDSSTATGGGAVMCWQNGVQKAVFGVTGAILGDTSADAGIYAETGQGIRFYGNGTERMRILSDGSILLGTTTAEGATGISFSNASDSAAYGKSMYMNSPYNGTRNAISFAYNSSGVGAIVTGTSSTSYNTSSDYRLKENIAPMTGALAKVALLKPCTYTWKIDGSEGQGFIAHELQSVVPDAVSGEKDAVETYTDKDGKEQTRIKPQGVDTSFLVATLTAAIQELKAELDATKAEVQALKAK